MKADSTIERLRAANPIQDTEAADAAELFARITASEPGWKQKRAENAPIRVHPAWRAPRRRIYGRPRLVIALALLAVALLASTAFAVSQLIGGHAVKPPVTRAEYRAAQSRLFLPPGYSWPKLHIDANSVTSPGAGGGHAVALAQNAWECYWVKAIRDGDRNAGERAHAALDDLVANHVVEAPVGAPEDWTPPHPPAGPYAVFAHDGGLDWVRGSYRQAAAGNPARLIASCSANGPG